MFTRVGGGGREEPRRKQNIDRSFDKHISLRVSLPPQPTSMDKNNGEGIVYWVNVHENVREMYKPMQVCCIEFTKMFTKCTHHTLS
jgi:hypothetical protein